ncbi:MAG: bacteriohopanetetrol glucosamine biosynthesis glycosyltransferase HpnI [Candidatus Eremiobacteraeota bacterium]|nr:bacteriohopanetetrol glucosamine biosynthesis glycosyltransferase HpnI [Candidatus Eremiobacteraeota bacterium]
MRSSRRRMARYWKSVGKLRSLLARLGFATSLAGLGYLVVALDALRRFERRPIPLGTASPSVTILKPLCGLDYELFENLRTFCEQAYPSFQIVFGVRDPEDPAVAVARSLIARYPERPFELVVGEAPALNPKVALLLKMIERANGELIVIADADIRVGPEYLRQVVAPFEDESIAAATCLFGGVPSGAPLSELAAMHVNDEFIPAVLVARLVEPLRYCIGATVAIRRRALDQLGGFGAFADALADDYEIGRLVTENGGQIALSSYVVHSVMDPAGLPELWLHELRWSRTIRAVRPGGYAKLFLTLPFPIALASALLARRRGPALFAAGAALALRVAMHYTARDALRVRTAPAPFLIPLRDSLSLAVWAAAYFGKEIRWRGRRYEVDARGRLAALPE